MRFLQWKQAQEVDRVAAAAAAPAALERYRYYQRLLGLAAGQRRRAGHACRSTARELTEENFDEAYAALVGQYDKAVATQATRIELRRLTPPASRSARRTGSCI